MSWTKIYTHTQGCWTQLRHHQLAHKTGLSVTSRLSALLLEKTKSLSTEVSLEKKLELWGGGGIRERGNENSHIIKRKGHPLSPGRLETLCKSATSRPPPATAQGFHSLYSGASHNERTV